MKSQFAKFSFFRGAMSPFPCHVTLFATMSEYHQYGCQMKAYFMRKTPSTFSQIFEHHMKGYQPHKGRESSQNTSPSPSRTSLRHEGIDPFDEFWPLIEVKAHCHIGEGLLADQGKRRRRPQLPRAIRQGVWSLERFYVLVTLYLT